MVGEWGEVETGGTPHPELIWDTFILSHMQVSLPMKRFQYFYTQVYATNLILNGYLVIIVMKWSHFLRWVFVTYKYLCLKIHFKKSQWEWWIIAISLIHGVIQWKTSSYLFRWEALCRCCTGQWFQLIAQKNSREGFLIPVVGVGWGRYKTHPDEGGTCQLLKGAGRVETLS